MFESDGVCRNSAAVSVSSGKDTSYLVNGEQQGWNIADDIMISTAGLTFWLIWELLPDDDASKSSGVTV